MNGSMVAWLGIAAVLIAAIFFVRKSWGNFKTGVGSFLFDTNQQARTSVMLWLSFIVIAVPFLVITLYDAFVKQVVRPDLTSWFWSGAMILIGASGGLHYFKTIALMKTGLYPGKEGDVNGGQGPAKPPVAG